MPDINELAPDGERLLTEFSGEIVHEHLHRYAIANKYAQGRDILDIACGEGYGSNLLSKNAQSVIGVDISASAIFHASRKYQRGNLKFLLGNCTSIPIPTGTIDLAVSFETLEHFADHDEFLKEIKRVLKPNGILIISTPDKYNYTEKRRHSNPFHVRELYQHDFAQLLESHFSNVALGKQLFHSGSIVHMYRPSELEYIQGDYENTEYSKFFDQAIYLLGFASDSILPPTSSGIYKANEPMAQDNDKKIIGSEIFISNDGKFTQSLSEYSYYYSGHVAKLRFANLRKHVNRGRIHLRFDPTDCVCAFSIIQMAITFTSPHEDRSTTVPIDINTDLVLEKDIIEDRHTKPQFISIGNDPSFLLPTIEWDGESDIILHIDIEIITNPKVFSEGLTKFLLNRSVATTNQERPIIVLHKDISAPAAQVENSRIGPLA